MRLFCCQAQSSAIVPSTIPSYSIVADSAEATGLKWAAPAGGGKVLQVVSTTITTEKQITSTSYTDTNLTLSITPSSATSKILVLVAQQHYITNLAASQGAEGQLVRDSTPVFVMAGANDWEMTFMEVMSAGRVQRASYINFNYLDSPATTSSVTYKTQAKLQAASGSIYFQTSSSPSQITLLEIGA